MMVSKGNLLFQVVIFRFHVKLWEGNFPLYQPPEKLNLPEVDKKSDDSVEYPEIFWDEVHPGFFRSEQIRIGGKKPVRALKTSKKRCLKKVMRGATCSGFSSEKLWGPGVQTQLSRCSNTAFAPRLDHFFLGTANLPMRCTLYHWKYPKRSRS